MQKKNGKERAAGEEKIELHLYYVIGRAGHRRLWTSLAVVAYRDGQLYCICTMSWDGPATGGSGHQLAVVAYRDGQLYCICTMS